MTSGIGAQWTIHFTGSYISNSQSVSEYEAGVMWGCANNADCTFLVRQMQINNIQQLQLYREEVDYQF